MSVTAAPPPMSLVRVLSAGLAYCIVVGSSILKVPQLFNIVKSRSADGVSLTSVLMEAAGYSIWASWGLARGLDFKDYGESLVITLQLALLVVLVGFYQNRMSTVALIYTPICVFGLIMATGFIPAVLHEALLSVQIVLGMCARVPQIYSNYKRKNTGELAFLTFFLAFGGCGARLLTTLINVPLEKGKLMLMLQFLIAGLLNFIVVAQITFYMYVRNGKLILPGKLGSISVPLLPTHHHQHN
jgi:mannose-P-dolichol utilization defect protein 1